MPAVLNPVLYRRLERCFGSVQVASPGEAMVMRAVLGHDREPRVLFEQDGEYYRACCPYCNDTRHRLYVNHMFGKRDGHGRKMLFLVHCFNEGCLNKPDNHEDFVAKMYDDFLASADVAAGKIVPEEARTVLWPGPCQRLDQLKDTHPSRAYLTARGFDPDMLAARYLVSYCTDSHYYLARNRIIIPIFDRDALKGWQARHVGELPWKDPEKKKDLPPKYFSCPNSKFRSRCVYNFDRMREWETGIIVEGPTDVWRFGLMAGCIFGNTLTELQRRRLATVFRARTLVLLLDPEEFDSRSTRRCVEWFDGRMSGRFCAVKLPEHTDPGSLGREFLRGYVKQEAARQGVRVVYRKC